MTNLTATKKWQPNIFDVAHGDVTSSSGLAPRATAQSRIVTNEPSINSLLPVLRRVERLSIDKNLSITSGHPLAR
jgi:hypothetical protein